MNYAVVNSKNIVENIVVMNNIADWIGDGAIYKIESDCGIGWTYENGTFTPPPTPELTHDEHVINAEIEKSNLLSSAQQVIGIWQTELQLGIIGDNEKATLIKWLMYIKQLNSIDTSIAPIKWPALPE